MASGELVDHAARIVAGLASTALVMVGGWAYRRYRRLRRVERAYHSLRDDHANLQGRYDRLRATDLEVRDRFMTLRGAYLALRDRRPPPAPPPVPDLTHEVARLRDEVDGLRVERDQARQLLEDAETRLAEMARQDGRLWLRPPSSPPPRFRPRADRRAVIVSVLNLKGGVGKTTLTANLAATLARPDRPVLMIDLDYQRSLSMLLVNDKRRGELHGNGWTVQHFLTGDTHRLADLTGKLEDLGPAVPDCSVLTNSRGTRGGTGADSLEEVENRLMAGWLVDRTRPDPRFFLREALHDPGLDFGYVFLDCPPRLTTACVNALAASDFVLVPVVPDAVSTHAAENLLRTLSEFQRELFPELAIAGIVPNMVRYRLEEPIQAHAAALGELRSATTGVYQRDEPVPIFAAGIPYASTFGVCAAAIDDTNKPRLAISDPEIGTAFRALADELEEACRARRRPAAVPAKSGARARSGR